MQNHHRIFQFVMALIMSLAVLVTAAVAQGKKGNPQVLPPHSNAYGMSYGEWSAAWWQWALSIPEARNPLYDTTGANCAEGQVGKVWFLAGTTQNGVPFARTCDVPVGKALFFPIVNIVFGSAVYDCDPTNPGVPCDVDVLRAGARAYTEPNVVELEATIDGVDLRSLENYRAASPVFIVTVPNGGIWGIPEGIYSPNVSNGYWLMLTPMSRGEHTIHFKGTMNTYNPPFTAEVTYHLNVVDE